MEPFVGQIIAVGFNFPPVGWLACNGQLVSISEYTVLFQLIGTTYGGDGHSTFALPDLRGRSPLGQGAGSSLPPVIIGQTGGTESVTLATGQIASHSHTLLAVSSTGSLSKPSTTAVLATQSNNDFDIYGPSPGNVTLAPAAVGQTGNTLPHENRQPFNTVNYIIAAFGVYPSQG